MFNPSEQSLLDFLEDLHHTGVRAFGDHARSMIENLLYTKMPLLLQKFINQAYLEIGTYDEIIKRIELEMEINIIEQVDDLPVTAMTATSKQQPNKDAKKPPDQATKKKRCKYYKKDGQIRDELIKLKNMVTILHDRYAIFCFKIGHTEERKALS